MWNLKKAVQKEKKPPYIWRRNRVTQKANMVTRWESKDSSVTESRPPLHDPMDCSTPGLPVHHRLPGLAQTHVPWVSDATQPSHPPSPPSPPTFDLSHGGDKWKGCGWHTGMTTCRQLTRTSKGPLPNTLQWPVGEKTLKKSSYRYTHHWLTMLYSTN